jgi:hypothetical protein
VPLVWKNSRDMVGYSGLFEVVGMLECEIFVVDSVCSDACSRVCMSSLL